MSKNKYLFPFILVTSLFFFWGFIHNLDPVLIPHLRRSFSLTTVEASLVDSSIFIAYFLMAIPAGLIIKKYGYKKGILTGLCFFAVGCFLFVPAANTMQYPFFLGALFVVACGLATLETVANPYVTLLGKPETSVQRLNFAHFFNGLAAFIAPTVGGWLILSPNPKSDAELAAMTVDARHAYLLSETSTVKLPYIILGSVILLIAIVFFFSKLPDKKESDEKEKAGFFHAFKHKHLTWAVVAQFFYIGAQICIFSLLILYADKVVGITEKQASYYASIAGLLFMLGRLAGTFFMQFIAPPKLLRIYAAICLLLTLELIFGKGIATMYAMLGITFFMSIMFPTIFALGIDGLGVDSKAGSSLLVMSIVGGALLPPVLGFIADKSGNFQYGYVVPLICFVVVLLFATIGYKRKGVDDNAVKITSTGH
ncbi:L-fucose:H+ symporter permease [Arachidicoccus ginsenosidimutans]|uniref:L-fucose:H+ symporter permease n=1 Tax=Arachidicoccus sp. BS20 TaxID=1850526 RepID=UPI0007F11E3F|nr:L-fucose:H+ symporter permease [Arachidicoccus sp. BS20]ANI88183.1 L-fucose:H+ symporter permease [Arachidicoccus sp. BS20]